MIELARGRVVGANAAASAGTGAPSARNILVAAALAGLVTAMPLWIPAGVVVGAAALILRQPRDRHATVEHSRRNVLRKTGVTTRTPTPEET